MFGFGIGVLILRVICSVMIGLYAGRYLKRNGVAYLMWSLLLGPMLVGLYLAIVGRTGTLVEKIDEVQKWIKNK